MAGYTVMIDRCCGCKRFFGFDPGCVPMALANGKPGPVCQDCMSEANRRRRSYGLPTLSIDPRAYAPLGGQSIG